MKLPFHIDLGGKVAVVTGGSGVLCSEFCLALAACGASVAIVNRNREKGQVVAEKIVASGGIAEAFSADVIDKASVVGAHEAIMARFGKCDILINGAGGNNPLATTDDEFFNAQTLLDPEKRSFFDVEGEGFQYVFNVNLMGIVLPTQVFAKDMLEHGGVVINVTSASASLPLTKVAAYSAAKSAVSNFTQWLAVHFAKSGIRVNAIAPGFFSTEQNKTLLWNADGSPTKRTEKILAGTPMGRFGVPQELIGTLLWLADEASSGFVTGAIIPVDGGFLSYSGV